MKRISLIILAVAAIIAGSVSCQKVNDLDKRLTELEQTVSDLKAQILAGAVITSVDKTDDGCTFILSNGQSYKVTNGKNGSDGEAIIADVKIEEDFIVLTLKDGETLRISYQNPLSMVTLDIVPDFDDGTVKEPKTSEAMGMKSTNFYLDISVTPAKYAEILSDTERFIHKAVFSSVQTKSGFGNAFTVSPKRVTYCEGAPIPFLQASFELDDESAAVLLNTPYTVSYSIADKDEVHGAATAFVTISHEKSSVPDVPSDGILTEGALPGVFTVADPDGIPNTGDERKVHFSKGNLMKNIEWRFFDHQYECSLDVGGDCSLFAWGAIDDEGTGWEVPVIDELTGQYEWGFWMKPKDTWHTLTKLEWAYLFGLNIDNEETPIYEINTGNPRSNLFRVGVDVMGQKCIVLYPDNYCGNKDETFATEKDYSEATKSGIVFLPAAGHNSKDGDSWYWSRSGSGSFADVLHSVGDDIVLISTTHITYSCSVRLVIYE